MNPYPMPLNSNQAMYPPGQPGVYPPGQPGVYPPPVTYPAQPVAVPTPIFGGMQFVYVQDPMAELASCPSLLIKQEPEFLENFTGCEMPNIYHVFGNSPLGFRYLFKCMEKSNCCSRKFCNSTQRPLDLDIIHCNSLDQLGMNYTTPFATMQKPFMCTCYCICRPEINVVLNSTGKAIGKVKHICTVCDPTFEVYSATSGLKYIVTGGATGQESIFNMLKAIRPDHADEDVVIVHDGNRPMLLQDVLTDNLVKQRRYGSAVAAIPCTEVVFISENKIDSDKSIPRENLQRTQTPHSYRLGDLWGAHIIANQKGITNMAASCSLMEAIGEKTIWLGSCIAVICGFLFSK